MTSVLARLLALPEVEPELTAARAAVDAALRQPAPRRHGAALAAEVAVRAAQASAALEGSGHDLDLIRAGTVTDPVAQGALRVNAALVGLAPRWFSAPRQVLARLHLLAATGCAGVDAESLGRPRQARDVAARLDRLCALVAEASHDVPALLRGAVVHGELLVLRPFAGPNGVVARAAGRLTFIAGGLDPGGLLAPEPSHRDRLAEYVGCANAFATGTPDGVRAWLRHCAAAVRSAADDLARADLPPAPTSPAPTSRRS